MKNLVIIGGGFAGSHAAKKLEKNKNFSITLIDQKEYFEFTPSILKAITSPNYLNKIHIHHKDYLKKSKFILGKVNKISQNHVHLKTPLKKIPYDYLIISTGSSYILPFKHHQTLQVNRGINIQKHNENLKNAKKIIIIGGGPVGVELAGELIDKYSDKEILLYQSAKTIIPRNSIKSQVYSQKILEKKGVKIILNKFFKESESSKEDLIFACTGIKPNINFEFITKDKSLEANKYLQLKPHRNIFIIGDVSNIKEEKTAQNAIRQAKTAITNIRRLEKNKSLKPHISKKTPQLITLGEDKGIFEYKNITIKGKLPIIMKNFVEKKEMRKLRN